MVTQTSVVKPPPALCKGIKGHSSDPDYSIMYDSFSAKLYKELYTHTWLILDISGYKPFITADKH